MAVLVSKNSTLVPFVSTIFTFCLLYKVSWIKKLNTSGSFWMQILATQTAISIPTLRETDYLTLDVLIKCKITKKPFWQEAFNSYLKVRENFLAEYPDQRLLQLINGNNQLTLDGRSANIPSIQVI